VPNHSRAILVGHLCADPEHRNTQDGTDLTKFRLAVNTGFGDKKKVMFIDVTCWRKTAEIAAKYLQKGSAVLVDGRLEMDQWTDKESGQMRTKHVVTATDISFIDTKPKDDAPQSRQRSLDIDDEAPPF